MKLLFIATICLLVSFLPNEAKAQSIGVVCDSCESTAQFIAASTSAALEGEQTGGFIQKEVYVISKASDAIRAFRVVTTPAEPGFPAQTMISEFTISSSDRTQLEAAKAELSIIENVWALGVEIDPSIANSAYDMVGDSSTRNAVIDYYNSVASIRQTILNFRSAALSVVTQFINVNAFTSMTFEDGTTAVFEISLSITADSQTEVQIDMKIDKIYDLNGNEINFDDMQIPVIPNGEYNFHVNSTTLQDFIDAARRAGIPIGDDPFICERKGCKVTIIGG